MTDADLDILDVTRAGVDVTQPTPEAGSSALLIVAVCIAMGLVIGIAFAIWFLIGSAWFGTTVPAFMQWLGLPAVGP